MWFEVLVNLVKYLAAFYPDLCVSFYATGKITCVCSYNIQQSSIVTDVMGDP